MFDVVIIGAGPAGLYSSIVLSGRGKTSIDLAQIEKKVDGREITEDR